MESFSNLPYKFVHQDIDLLVLDIIQFIIIQRKQQEFKVTTDITQEERLVSELFKQLKVKNTVSLVTEKSYSWLSVNLSGGIKNKFNNKAITGTTFTGETRIQVKYANPNVDLC